MLKTPWGGGGSTRSNLLLEGDNFAWLKILEQTHSGKIDIIYIDPPYNTGKKDFTYNDSFVGNDDAFRYSKWLDFMDRRLRIARNLLTPKGIILISIDENALAHLWMLCNDIFGDNNYVENFIWAKNSLKNHSTKTSTMHEYILCYAKDINCAKGLSLFREPKPGYLEVTQLIDDCKNNGVPISEAQKLLRKLYSDHAKDIEENNAEDDVEEWKGITQYKYIDDEYRVYRISDSSAPNSNNYYDVIHPKTGKRCAKPSRGWAICEDEMKARIANGDILFGADEKNVPQFKTYLSDVQTNIKQSIIVDYDDGEKEVKKIFNSPSSPLSNPKPVSLIRQLITGCNNNAIILDFFAGSGTTAQAVEELNLEDKANRRWILCTNNERDICRSITKPRIDAVLSGMRPDGSKYFYGIDGSSYDYYTLDFVERQSVVNTQTSIIGNDDAMLSLVLMSRNVGHDKINSQLSDTQMHTFISDDIDIVFINDACDADVDLTQEIRNACESDGKVHEVWISSSDEAFNSKAIEMLTAVGFDIHKKDELLSRKYVGKQEVL